MEGKEEGETTESMLCFFLSSVWLRFLIVEVAFLDTQWTEREKWFASIFSGEQIYTTMCFM